MCYAVFIATKKPQETTVFVEDVTKLYLEQPTAEQLNGLRAKFSLSYVYYVGSATGCSCDFEFHSEWFDDPEWQDSKASPQALLDLLNELTVTGDVEFYCCWDGDWDEPIEHSRVLKSGDSTLANNYFELVEREFIRFVKCN